MVLVMEGVEVMVMEAVLKVAVTEVAMVLVGMEMVEEVVMAMVVKAAAWAVAMVEGTRGDGQVERRAATVAMAAAMAAVAMVGCGVEGTDTVTQEEQAVARMAEVVMGGVVMAVESCEGHSHRNLCRVRMHSPWNLSHHLDRRRSRRTRRCSGTPEVMAGASEEVWQEVERLVRTVVAVAHKEEG